MAKNRVARHGIEEPHPFHRLPFVGEFDWPRGFRDEFSSKRSNWALPASDHTSADCAEYGDGCDAGKAAALAHLKMLRARGQSLGGYLQYIVLDMADRWALSRQACGTSGSSELKGQIVGFCAELERWVVASARNFGSELDCQTEEQIAATLQDAVDGGPSKRWRAKLAAERSERARHAAHAGWAKRRKRKRLAA
jgi:hypothetical protein